jgi:hypothetical protein
MHNYEAYMNENIDFAPQYGLKFRCIAVIYKAKWRFAQQKSQNRGG